MKKIFSSIIVFVLILLTSPVYADSTYEIEINKAYTEFCMITRNNANGDIVFEKSNAAIDYGIEIFKNKPYSLEAYNVIFNVARVFKANTFQDKFKKLKDKHMPYIDDPNFEPYEKIMFLQMLMSGFAANNMDEIKLNQDIVQKALINMKDNCQDLNYSALATILLFFDKQKYKEYKQYFKEKFPDHPAMPKIEMTIIYDIYHKDKQYQACIDEFKKMADKYKDISTPNGWKLSMDCYNVISFVYAEMKEYENAKKYYDMIEKESPNYWNLKNLKEEIESIKR